MIEPVDGGGSPRTRAPQWCDTCGRVVGPDELVASGEGRGRCPTCGEELSGEEAPDDEAPAHAPWHFKLLVVGTVGYLIYRVIWFIGWLHHHG